MLSTQKVRLGMMRLLMLNMVGDNTKVVVSSTWILHLPLDPERLPIRVRLRPEILVFHRTSPVQQSLTPVSGE